MKILTCICLLLSFSFWLNAQSINPEVLSSAGDEWEVVDFGTLTWTLGELATSTYSNDNRMLTEGFHQPVDLSTPVLEHPALDLNISIFPNPTTGILQVYVDQISDPITFTVMDLLGNRWGEHVMSASRTWISLENMPPGIYFIQGRLQTDPIGTFKIQKL